MGNNKVTVINRIIDGISGIFLPFVSLLSAAGILKGILAVLIMTGALTESGDTYLVLNAMADSLFYFLPMVLAFTSAQKFNTNPFTAVVIAGVLLYPSLTAAFDIREQIVFAGLPIQSVVYHSSVIPIILAVGLLKYVEQLSNRLLPGLISGFLTPLVGILVVGLTTLLVFGPIGKVVGDGLAVGYEAGYGISPVLAGAVLGAVIQLMVIFGFHWSFVLIAMNNINVNGSDTVLVLIGPAVFAQAGAAMAVFFKSKDQQFRSICLSAALSACFGVTEPAMFGVNLPLKRPMLAVCLGGGVGGALAGLSGARAMAFAFPSLVSLPVFMGQGFGIYLLSCAAGFATAFIVTLVLPFTVKAAK